MIQLNRYLINESTDSILATNILKPESIIEEFIGLRGKCLLSTQAMLWEFSDMQYNIFDTFFCNSIGYIALNTKKQIINYGIMNKNKIKFIRCAFWIELNFLKTFNLNIGDPINWDI